MRYLGHRKPRRALLDYIAKRELRSNIPVPSCSQKQHQSASSRPAQQAVYSAQVSKPSEVEEDYSEPGNSGIFPVSATELCQDPNDTWMDFAGVEETIAINGMRANFDMEYRATPSEVLDLIGMHIEDEEHIEKHQETESYDYV